MSRTALYESAIATFEHLNQFLLQLEGCREPAPANSRKLRQLAFSMFTELNLQIILQFEEDSVLRRRLQEKYESAMWTIHAKFHTTQEGTMYGKQH